jgi:hypothetical protein
MDCPLILKFTPTHPVPIMNSFPTITSIAAGDGGMIEIIIPVDYTTVATTCSVTIDGNNTGKCEIDHTTRIVRIAHNLDPTRTTKEITVSIVTVINPKSNKPSTPFEFRTKEKLAGYTQFYDIDVSTTLTHTATKLGVISLFSAVRSV